MFLFYGAQAVSDQCEKKGPKEGDERKPSDSDTHQKPGFSCHHGHFRSVKFQESDSFFLCVCVCVCVCARVPLLLIFCADIFFYIPLPGILVVIIFIPRYCCRLAFIIIYASVKEVGGTGEEASG